MKKIVTIPAVLIAVVLFTSQANATKWRVNNTGVAANFTTLQAAHDGAAAGDTLYIESSRVPYGNLNCTKRLIIIGTGYFLGENDSTQANFASSMADYIQFSAGSENSIIMGMTSLGGIYCGASRVLIKRNNIYSDMNAAANNVVITQCYMVTMTITGGFTGVTVTNSVISYNGTSGYALVIGGASSATISNNIIAGGQNLNSAEYYNNISTGVSGMQTQFSASYCTVYNNIGAANQYVAYNDSNTVNTNMATVFTNTGSTDGKYKLIPVTSPAIQWGHDKADCGIFGGPTPYVLSGMPPVPAIWQLQVNGTNVLVKAKSH